MALHMTEEEFISLGIEVQDAGFNALNQHLDNVETHIQSVGAAVESVNHISEAPLEKLTDHFEQTNKQIQETNDSLDKLRAGLGDMPDFGGGDEGGGFSTAGLSRGLSSAGMLARRAGAPELGAGLQDISALIRVQTAVGKLEDQLGNLPGILGEAATEGEALAGGLGSVLAVAGPLVLAVGAIAVGFKVFVTDTLEPANKALQDAKTSVDEYYAAIGKGTTDSLKKQISDLEEQKKLVDEKIKNIANALGQGLENAVQQFGSTGVVLFDAATKAGAFGGGIKDLNKDLDDSKKQSTDLQNKIDGLNRAMGSAAVSANDAAKSEKALQDARDKTADKNIQVAVQTEQLERTGTSKAVQDRIAAIESEKKAILDELGTQQVSLDKRIELTRRVGELSNEEDKLTNAVLPLVQAREAEEKSAKDSKKALDDITKAHETYEKSIESAKTALDNQIQTAKAREALAEQQNRSGSLQDTEQREKIRLDEGRKETQLAQESADRLVDIRAKEGQDEQHVQVDLQRQFTDDVTKFQEQQQTDALNHEQRLAQIKSDAQDAELDDIANRDFAKLAQDQEGAKKQESQEDQKFAQQEQQLAIHLQQEEKQQQIAAQRRLDDLRTAEAFQEQEQQIADQRKIDALRQSEQYQLDDLTTAEGYKIQILRVSLQNEITLYQQQEQQRLQIAQQTQAAIIASAQQQIARLNPTGSAILDLGGMLNDQLAQMFSQ